MAAILYRLKCDNADTEVYIVFIPPQLKSNIRLNSSSSIYRNCKIIIPNDFVGVKYATQQVAVCVGNVIDWNSLPRIFRLGRRQLMSNCFYGCIHQGPATHIHTHHQPRSPFVPIMACHQLLYWDRVTQICVSDLIIIGSDNGLPAGPRQAIIWPNAGIILTAQLEIYFNELLIEIQTFLSMIMNLKMSSGKWRLFRLGLNVLSVNPTSEVLSCG